MREGADQGREAIARVREGGEVDIRAVKFAGERKKMSVNVSLEDYQYIEETAKRTGFKMSFLANYGLFLYLRALEEGGGR